MAIAKAQVVGQRGSGGDRTAASIAVASGDVLVAVCTAQDSNTNNITVTSVKFNTTESFTKQGSGYGGSGGTGQPCRIEIWYLTNPTATTASVIADFASGINESTLTVYRLSGADAADLINGEDGDTGNGFAPAMSITTDVDSCFLIGGICSEAEITGYGTGQTEDGNYDDQSYENSNASSEAGGTAGAQAHSYDMSGGNPYAQMVVAINPGSSSTNTNSSRGAVITGKDTANASRGALTTGKTATSDSRGAVTTGKDTTNATRGAVITGKDTSNASRGALLTGADSANATRGAVITGKDTTNSSRPAIITGIEGANDNRNALITGIDATFSSRGAVVTGKDISEANRGVILTGATGANDSRGATLLGKDTTNTTRGAHITGKDTSVSSRGALLTGIAAANDTRGAVVTGKDSINDSRGAILTGNVLVSDSRPAKIHGIEQVVSEIMANLWGKDTSFSFRAAFITGFDITNSSRGAVVTGKLDRGRPTVLPGVTGATILVNRQSRTTIPSRTPTIL